jgi:hypothetical protein
VGGGGKSEGGGVNPFEGAGFWVEEGGQDCEGVQDCSEWTGTMVE